MGSTSTPYPTPPLQVQIDRIRSDILALANIGRNRENNGIYRMAFTDADMEGKSWLVDRIEQAGLEPFRDGAANIYGVLRGKADDAPVFVGSHIDTVPCAGMFDGTLGVVVGLECLRVLKEADVELERSLELVAFSDEEGRFGGTFGSEAFTGLLTLEKLRNAVDLQGIRLEDAMKKQGLDPMKFQSPRPQPGDAVHNPNRNVIPIENRALLNVQFEVG